MKLFIGIDIGGTKCAVCLAKVDGGIHILDKLVFSSNAARGFESMYGDLLATLDDLLARQGLTSRDIRAIGISCGGPLDSKRGVVLCPPNLPGWVDIPLCEMIGKRYGVPAYLLNDANACALVEWKLGAGRGTKNMVFLTMGTGMGGGVISDGRLLSGASDMAGEIGHLRLHPTGPIGFGKAGSFEGYCSGGGIARQAQAYTRALVEKGEIPAWIKDGVNVEEISAGLIAKYAFAGDADAQKIYEEIGYWLGKGLALITDMFNPECIVIGSIFARSHQLLEKSMYESLKEEAIPYSLSALSVVPAETGESLGDHAAIMTALYALDIDPMYKESEDDPCVLAHYDRLFERYPALNGLKDSVMEAYIALRDSFESGGKLLLCGNGGSAADSAHIVGELMKGFYLKRPLKDRFPGMPLQGALPAVALTEQSALSTAFGNDVDAAYVFAQQTLGLGKKGDVLLAISTSGNSVNVVNAAQVAKETGLKVLSLTGTSGGKLRDISDVCITAPASTPADVQEYHLPIYHALCAMLEAHFFKE